MELHERQQFDFLLMTAVERYVERLEQRNGSVEDALARLRSGPNGEGVWLDEFVAAIFDDFLLDNIGGACFVLEALAKRTLPETAAGRVETVLIEMARTAFAGLLKQKTEEALEQRLAFQPADSGGSR
jgi:hypothetical protein